MHMWVRPLPAPHSFLLLWALASFPWRRGAGSWLPLGVERARRCWGELLPKGLVLFQCRGSLLSAGDVCARGGLAMLSGPDHWVPAAGLPCGLAHEVCHLASTKGLQKGYPPVGEDVLWAEGGKPCSGSRVPGSSPAWRCPCPWSALLSLARTLQDQRRGWAPPPVSRPLCPLPGHPLGAPWEPRLPSPGARGPGGPRRSEDSVSPLLFSGLGHTLDRGAGWSCQPSEKGVLTEGLAFWESPSGLGVREEPWRLVWGRGGWMAPDTPGPSCS